MGGRGGKHPFWVSIKHLAADIFSTTKSPVAQCFTSMQSSSDIGLVANSFHRCWPTAVIILFTSLGGKWRNAVDSPLFDVVEALAAFVLIGIHNGWLNGPSKDSRGGSDHRCITDASPMRPLHFHHQTTLKSQKVCRSGRPTGFRVSPERKM
jgi:hypothetical protein